MSVQRTVNVTNSSSSAVTGNPSSYVNVTTGSLQRTLPANLSGTGNNYLFPIGEGSVYKAINLIDVNTGGTGPMLSASVSPTGALTGDNITVSIIRPRYWSLINTNGGNFTSASVELFDENLDETSVVCISSASAGTYSAIGGIAGGASITSPSVLNPGPYFAIGTLDYSVFYSYRSGNWHDPYTWTSDPSGTLQIGNVIPGNGDKVIILTDRTVTMAQNVTESGLYVTVELRGFPGSVDLPI